MDYTKASESDLFDVLYFIPSPTLFVCFHAGSIFAAAPLLIPFVVHELRGSGFCAACLISPPPPLLFAFHACKSRSYLKTLGLVEKVA